MKRVVHRAGSRGAADYGWLQTRYSFSFADWHAPDRMGFGALRVWNDDVIAPGKGFGMHRHENMEIVTVVLRGAVAHRDSQGGEGVTRAGEVQAMSAGAGVAHSEWNASDVEPLELFQIWIEPRTRGGEPRYAQRSFAETAASFGATLLVGPEGEDGLAIGQDARLWRVVVDAGHPVTISLRDGYGAYVFVVSGAIAAAGEGLAARDAVGVSETREVSIQALASAVALVAEVPMAGDW